MNIRMRHLITALGALALLATATASDARPRIELLNGGQGVASPVRPPSATNDGRESTVRLQGELSYNRREGLSLNGRAISITPRTASFGLSGPANRMIDPAKLGGRKVTVFGRDFNGVLDAGLLIFAPRPQDLSTTTGTVPMAYMRPSSVDPDLNELTTEAPR